MDSLPETVLVVMAPKRPRSTEPEGSESKRSRSRASSSPPGPRSPSVEAARTRRFSGLVGRELDVERAEIVSAISQLAADLLEPDYESTEYQRQEIQGQSAPGAFFRETTTVTHQKRIRTVVTEHHDVPSSSRTPTFSDVTEAFPRVGKRTVSERIEGLDTASEAISGPDEKGASRSGTDRTGGPVSVARKSSTGGPDPPKARKSSSVKSKELTLRKSSTEGPDRSTHLRSSTEGPDQPLLRQSTTEGPDEPLIKKSSTEGPDEPLIKKSSTEGPDQPITRESSAEGPADPAAEVEGQDDSAFQRPTSVKTTSIDLRSSSGGSRSSNGSFGKDVPDMSSLSREERLAIEALMARARSEGMPGAIISPPDPNDYGYPLLASEAASNTFAKVQRPRPAHYNSAAEEEPARKSSTEGPDKVPDSSATSGADERKVESGPESSLTVDTRPFVFDSASLRFVDSSISSVDSAGRARDEAAKRQHESDKTEEGSSTPSPESKKVRMADSKKDSLDIPLPNPRLKNQTSSEVTEGPDEDTSEFYEADDETGKRTKSQMSTDQPIDTSKVLPLPPKRDSLSKGASNSSSESDSDGEGRIRAASGTLKFSAKTHSLDLPPTTPLLQQQLSSELTDGADEADAAPKDLSLPSSPEMEVVREDSQEHLPILQPESESPAEVSETVAVLSEVEVVKEEETIRQPLLPTSSEEEEESQVLTAPEDPFPKVQIRVQEQKVTRQTTLPSQPPPRPPPPRRYSESGAAQCPLLSQKRTSVSTMHYTSQTPVKVVSESSATEGPDDRELLVERSAMSGSDRSERTKSEKAPLLSSGSTEGPDEQAEYQNTTSDDASSYPQHLTIEAEVHPHIRDGMYPVSEEPTEEEMGAAEEPPPMESSPTRAILPDVDLSMFSEDEASTIKSVMERAASSGAPSLPPSLPGSRRSSRQSSDGEHQLPNVLDDASFAQKVAQLAEDFETKPREQRSDEEDPKPAATASESPTLRHGFTRQPTIQELNISEEPTSEILGVFPVIPVPTEDLNLDKLPADERIIVETMMKKPERVDMRGMRPMYMDPKKIPNLMTADSIDEEPQTSSFFSSFSSAIKQTTQQIKDGGALYYSEYMGAVEPTEELNMSPVEAEAPTKTVPEEGANTIPYDDEPPPPSPSTMSGSTIAGSPSEEAGLESISWTEALQVVEHGPVVPELPEEDSSTAVEKTPSPELLPVIQEPVTAVKTPTTIPITITLPHSSSSSSQSSPELADSSQPQQPMTEQLDMETTEHKNLTDDEYDRWVERLDASNAPVSTLDADHSSDEERSILEDEKVTLSRYLGLDDTQDSRQSSFAEEERGLVDYMEAGEDGQMATSVEQIQEPFKLPEVRPFDDFDHSEIPVEEEESPTKIDDKPHELATREFLPPTDDWSPTDEWGRMDTIPEEPPESDFHRDFFKREQSEQASGITRRRISEENVLYSMSHKLDKVSPPQRSFSISSSVASPFLAEVSPEHSAARAGLSTSIAELEVELQIPDGEERANISSALTEKPFVLLLDSDDESSRKKPKLDEIEVSSPLQEEVPTTRSEDRDSPSVAYNEYPDIDWSIYEPKERRQILSVMQRARASVSHSPRSPMPAGLPAQSLADELAFSEIGHQGPAIEQPPAPEPVPSRSYFGFGGVASMFSETISAAVTSMTAAAAEEAVEEITPISAKTNSKGTDKRVEEEDEVAASSTLPLTRTDSEEIHFKEDYTSTEIQLLEEHVESIVRAASSEDTEGPEEVSKSSDHSSKGRRSRGKRVSFGKSGTDTEGPDEISEASEAADVVSKVSQDIDSTLAVVGKTRSTDASEMTDGPDEMSPSESFEKVTKEETQDLPSEPLKSTGFFSGLRMAAESKSKSIAAMASQLASDVKERTTKESEEPGLNSRDISRTSLGEVKSGRESKASTSTDGPDEFVMVSSKDVEEPTVIVRQESGGTEGPDTEPSEGSSSKNLKIVPRVKSFSEATDGPDEASESKEDENLHRPKMLYEPSEATEGPSDEDMPDIEIPKSPFLQRTNPFKSSSEDTGGPSSSEHLDEFQYQVPDEDVLSATQDKTDTEVKVSSESTGQSESRVLLLRSASSAATEGPDSDSGGQEMSEEVSPRKLISGNSTEGPDEGSFEDMEAASTALEKESKSHIPEKQPKGEEPPMAASEWKLPRRASMPTREAIGPFGIESRSGGRRQSIPSARWFFKSTEEESTEAASSDSPSPNLYRKRMSFGFHDLLEEDEPVEPPRPAETIPEDIAESTISLLEMDDMEIPSLNICPATPVPSNPSLDGEEPVEDDIPALNICPPTPVPSSPSLDSEELPEFNDEVEQEVMAISAMVMQGALTDIAMKLICEAMHPPSLSAGPSRAKLPVTQEEDEDSDELMFHVPSLPSQVLPVPKHVLQESSDNESSGMTEEMQDHQESEPESDFTPEVAGPETGTEDVEIEEMETTPEVVKEEIPEELVVSEVQKKHSSERGIDLSGFTVDEQRQIEEVMQRAARSVSGASEERRTSLEQMKDDIFTVEYPESEVSVTSLLPSPLTSALKPIPQTPSTHDSMVELERTVTHIFESSPAYNIHFCTEIPASELPQESTSDTAVVLEKPTTETIKSTSANTSHFSAEIPVSFPELQLPTSPLIEDRTSLVTMPATDMAETETFTSAIAQSSADLPPRPKGKDPGQTEQDSSEATESADEVGSANSSSATSGPEDASTEADTNLAMAVLPLPPPRPAPPQPKKTGFSIGGFMSAVSKQTDTLVSKVSHVVSDDVSHESTSEETKQSLKDTSGIFSGATETADVKSIASSGMTEPADEHSASSGLTEPADEGGNTSMDEPIQEMPEPASTVSVKKNKGDSSATESADEVGGADSSRHTSGPDEADPSESSSKERRRSSPPPRPAPPQTQKKSGSGFSIGGFMTAVGKKTDTLVSKASHIVSDVVLHESTSAEALKTTEPRAASASSEVTEPADEKSAASSGITEPADGKSASSGVTEPADDRMDTSIDEPLSEIEMPSQHQIEEEIIITENPTMQTTESGEIQPAVYESETIPMMSITDTVKPFGHRETTEVDSTPAFTSHFCAEIPAAVPGIQIIPTDDETIELTTPQTEVRESTDFDPPVHYSSTMPTTSIKDMTEPLDQDETRVVDSSAAFTSHFCVDIPSFTPEETHEPAKVPSRLLKEDSSTTESDDEFGGAESSQATDGPDEEVPSLAITQESQKEAPKPPSRPPPPRIASEAKSSATESADEEAPESSLPTSRADEEPRKLMQSSEVAPARPAPPPQPKTIGFGFSFGGFMSAIEKQTDTLVSKASHIVSDVVLPISPSTEGLKKTTATLKDTAGTSSDATEPADEKSVASSGITEPPDNPSHSSGLTEPADDRNNTSIDEPLSESELTVQLKSAEEVVTDNLIQDTIESAIIPDPIHFSSIIPSKSVAEYSTPIEQEKTEVIESVSAFTTHFCAEMPPPESQPESTHEEVKTLVEPQTDTVQSNELGSSNFCAEMPVILPEPERAADWTVSMEMLSTDTVVSSPAYSSHFCAEIPVPAWWPPTPPRLDDHTEPLPQIVEELAVANTVSNPVRFCAEMPVKQLTKETARAVSESKSSVTESADEEPLSSSLPTSGDDEEETGQISAHTTARPEPPPQQKKTGFGFSFGGFMSAIEKQTDTLVFKASHIVSDVVLHESSSTEQVQKKSPILKDTAGTSSDATEPADEKSAASSGITEPPEHPSHSSGLTETADDRNNTSIDEPLSESELTAQVTSAEEVVTENLIQDIIESAIIPDSMHFSSIIPSKRVSEYSTPIEQEKTEVIESVSAFTTHFCAEMPPPEPQPESTCEEVVTLVEPQTETVESSGLASNTFCAEMPVILPEPERAVDWTVSMEMPSIDTVVSYPAYSSHYCAEIPVPAWRPPTPPRLNDHTEPLPQIVEELATASTVSNPVRFCAKMPVQQLKEETVRTVSESKSSATESADEEAPSSSLPTSGADEEETGQISAHTTALPEPPLQQKKTGFGFSFGGFMSAIEKQTDTLVSKASHIVSDVVLHESPSTDRVQKKSPILKDTAGTSSNATEPADAKSAASSGITEPPEHPSHSSGVTEPADDRNNTSIDEPLSESELPAQVKSAEEVVTENLIQDTIESAIIPDPIHFSSIISSKSVAEYSTPIEQEKTEVIESVSAFTTHFCAEMPPPEPQPESTCEKVETLVEPRTETVESSELASSNFCAEMPVILPEPERAADWTVSMEMPSTATVVSSPANSFHYCAEMPIIFPEPEKTADSTVPVEIPSTAIVVSSPANSSHYCAEMPVPVWRPTTPPRMDDHIEPLKPVEEERAETDDVSNPSHLCAEMPVPQPKEPLRAASEAKSSATESADDEAPVSSQPTSGAEEEPTSHVPVAASAPPTPPLQQKKTGFGFSFGGFMSAIEKQTDTLVSKATHIVSDVVHQESTESERDTKAVPKLADTAGTSSEATEPPDEKSVISSSDITEPPDERVDTSIDEPLTDYETTTPASSMPELKEEPKLVSITEEVEFEPRDEEIALVSNQPLPLKSEIVLPNPEKIEDMTVHVEVPSTSLIESSAAFSTHYCAEMPPTEWRPPTPPKLQEHTEQIKQPHTELADTITITNPHRFCAEIPVQQPDEESEPAAPEVKEESREQLPPKPVSAPARPVSPPPPKKSGFGFSFGGFMSAIEKQTDSLVSKATHIVTHESTEPEKDTKETKVPHHGIEAEQRRKGNTEPVSTTEEIEFEPRDKEIASTSYQPMAQKSAITIPEQERAEEETVPLEVPNTSLLESTSAFSTHYCAEMSIPEWRLPTPPILEHSEPLNQPDLDHAEVVKVTNPARCCAEITMKPAEEVKRAHFEAKSSATESADEEATVTSLPTSGAEEPPKPTPVSRATPHTPASTSQPKKTGFGFSFGGFMSAIEKQTDNLVSKATHIVTDVVHQESTGSEHETKESSKLEDMSGAVSDVTEPPDEKSAASTSEFTEPADERVQTFIDEPLTDFETTLPARVVSSVPDLREEEETQTKSSGATEEMHDHQNDTDISDSELIDTVPYAAPTVEPILEEIEFEPRDEEMATISYQPLPLNAEILQASEQAETSAEQGPSKPIPIPSGRASVPTVDLSDFSDDERRQIQEVIRRASVASSETRSFTKSPEPPIPEDMDISAQVQEMTSEFQGMFAADDIEIKETKDADITVDLAGLTEKEKLQIEQVMKRASESDQAPAAVAAISETIDHSRRDSKALDSSDLSTPAIHVEVPKEEGFGFHALMADETESRRPSDSTSVAKSASIESDLEAEWRPESPAGLYGLSIPTLTVRPATPAMSQSSTEEELNEKAGEEAVVAESTAITEDIEQTKFDSHIRASSDMPTPEICLEMATEEGAQTYGFHALMAEADDDPRRRSSATSVGSAATSIESDMVAEWRPESPAGLYGLTIPTLSIRPATPVMSLSSTDQELNFKALEDESAAEETASSLTALIMQAALTDYATDLVMMEVEHMKEEIEEASDLLASSLMPIALQEAMTELAMQMIVDGTDYMEEEQLPEYDTEDQDQRDVSETEEIQEGYHEDQQYKQEETDNQTISPDDEYETSLTEDEQALMDEIMAKAEAELESSEEGAVQPIIERLLQAKLSGQSSDDRSKSSQPEHRDSSEPLEEPPLDVFKVCQPPKTTEEASEPETDFDEFKVCQPKPIEDTAESDTDMDEFKVCKPKPAEETAEPDTESNEFKVCQPKSTKETVDHETDFDGEFKVCQPMPAQETAEPETDFDEFKVCKPKSMEVTSEPENDFDDEFKVCKPKPTEDTAEPETDFDDEFKVCQPKRVVASYEPETGYDPYKIEVVGPAPGLSDLTEEEQEIIQAVMARADSSLHPTFNWTVAANATDEDIDIAAVLAASREVAEEQRLMAQFLEEEEAATALEEETPVSPVAEEREPQPWRETSSPEFDEEREEIQIDVSDMREEELGYPEQSPVTLEQEMEEAYPEIVAELDQQTRKSSQASPAEDHPETEPVTDEAPIDELTEEGKQMIAAANARAEAAGAPTPVVEAKPVPPKKTKVFSGFSFGFGKVKSMVEKQTDQLIAKASEIVDDIAPPATETSPESKPVKQEDEMTKTPVAVKTAEAEKPQQPQRATALEDNPEEQEPQEHTEDQKSEQEKYVTELDAEKYEPLEQSEYEGVEDKLLEQDDTFIGKESEEMDSTAQQSQTKEHEEETQAQLEEPIAEKVATAAADELTEEEKKAIAAVLARAEASEAATVISKPTPTPVQTVKPAPTKETSGFSGFSFGFGKMKTMVEKQTDQLIAKATEMVDDVTHVAPPTAKDKTPEATKPAATSELANAGEIMDLAKEEEQLVFVPVVVSTADAEEQSRPLQVTLLPEDYSEAMKPSGGTVEESAKTEDENEPLEQSEYQGYPEAYYHEPENQFQEESIEFPIQRTENVEPAAVCAPVKEAEEESRSRPEAPPAENDLTEEEKAAIAAVLARAEASEAATVISKPKHDPAQAAKPAPTKETSGFSGFSFGFGKMKSMVEKQTDQFISKATEMVDDVTHVAPPTAKVKTPEAPTSSVAVKPAKSGEILKPEKEDEHLEFVPVVVSTADTEEQRRPQEATLIPEDYSETIESLDAPESAVRMEEPVNDEDEYEPLEQAEYEGYPEAYYHEPRIEHLEVIEEATTQELEELETQAAPFKKSEDETISQPEEPLEQSDYQRYPESDYPETEPQEDTDQIATQGIEVAESADMPTPVTEPEYEARTQPEAPTSAVATTAAAELTEAEQQSIAAVLARAEAAEAATVISKPQPAPTTKPALAKETPFTGFSFGFGKMKSMVEKQTDQFIAKATEMVDDISKEQPESANVPQEVQPSLVATASPEPVPELEKETGMPPVIVDAPEAPAEFQQPIRPGAGRMLAGAYSAEAQSSEATGSADEQETTDADVPELELAIHESSGATESADEKETGQSLPEPPIRPSQPLEEEQEPPAAVAVESAVVEKPAAPAPAPPKAAAQPPKKSGFGFSFGGFMSAVEKQTDSLVSKATHIVSETDTLVSKATHIVSDAVLEESSSESEPVQAKSSLQKAESGVSSEATESADELASSEATEPPDERSRTSLESKRQMSKLSSEATEPPDERSLTSFDDHMTDMNQEQGYPVEEHQYPEPTALAEARTPEPVIASQPTQEPVRAEKMPPPPTSVAVQKPVPAKPTPTKEAPKRSGFGFGGFGLGGMMKMVEKQTDSLAKAASSALADISDKPKEASEKESPEKGTAVVPAKTKAAPKPELGSPDADYDVRQFEHTIPDIPSPSHSLGEELAALDSPHQDSLYWRKHDSSDRVAEMIAEEAPSVPAPPLPMEEGFEETVGVKEVDGIGSVVPLDRRISHQSPEESLEDDQVQPDPFASLESKGEGGGWNRVGGALGPSN